MERIRNENKSDKYWGTKTSLTEENEYLQFKDYEKSRYVVSGDTESEKESDGDVKKNQMMKSKDNKKQIFKNQPISTFIETTASDFHKQVNNYTQQYSSEINASLDNHLQKYHEEDITLFDKKNIRLLISDKNMYRLEKLIEKHPNGIWCADLPKKYLEEYHVPLNYDELGFSSVREFASCLPEIFHCKKLSQSEDFILYNAKDELIDINEKIPPKKVGSYTQSHLIENETNALPVILSNNTSNKLIPEDVMTLGESVEQIYVKNLQNGPQQCVEVYVEEVFTPSLFWIQLRKERKHFSKLMDALHIFYEEHFLNYKIPIAVLEKGLNCACKYDNIWHRGIIKSVRYDLHVTIMFYDFGTLKTYSPDEIFYLHRSFSYLPAQAIPCGLYNIKPCVGEKWSQNVTQEFACKIYEQPLVATVVSTDPENNSMLVTLTDTQEEEDVHINDWMIHQNLAVCGQMGDVVDMSNLMLFVEENLLYNPEKCYEKDYDIPNVKDDEIHNNGTENIPLISPKSTLPKNACKMDFKTNFKPFSNESTYFKTMGEESGNPFLESIRKQTEFFNTSLPELFMQTLETNETFQKQISFIFSYLILKLDPNFLENNYNLPENELKKNYEECLLHTSKLLTNFVIEKDISMLSTVKAPNYLNTDIGLQFDQNKRMFIPLFVNNNNNNYVANKKSRINDYNKNKEQYELFEPNNDTNNIVLNSEPQIPYVQPFYTDHDKSAIINSCEEKSAKTELKTKTAAFPHQNYIKDKSKNEVNIFDAILRGEITYNEFDKINLFNETNPFKITLKPKGKNSQYETSNMNFFTSLRSNVIEESSINSTFVSTSNIAGISNELGYDRKKFNPNSEHNFNMPSTEYINKLKVLGSQEPINSERNYIKDVENGRLSLVNVPNKSYINQSCMDSIGMSNIHQQYQATAANSNNYEKANTNFDSKYTSYPYRKYTNNNEGNINSDRWEGAAVEINTVLTAIYFRKIDLSNKEIYIFHLDNQGWLRVEDFVSECTNYKTITEFYEKLDNNCLSVIEFKTIKKYPLFLYDHMTLTGIREEMNKGLSIHLININCILIIMGKLGIIPPGGQYDDIIGVDNKAFFYNACIVKAKYRALRSSIPKRLE
ncbi:PREDICTED: uncharacterized protein LOC107069053 isoform X2 [Polistes dominula]|uniref:Uncharacterized protein LOC107069053 isoform X2 n=1 Tax=Polistes dominula TaxID=743375 RepID=A0ABM1IMP7_POLDO|nr:PREDICTED: uncharacterized protein LOC107069053 isoform X2 [Polistes dominula]